MGNHARTTSAVHSAEVLNMSYKKAQGLSFNFIVIIAISLVVMLVVIGIFAARSSEGNENLRSCEARNGVCTSASSCDEAEEDGASSTPMMGAVCYDDEDKDEVDDDQTCCIRNQD